MRRAPGLPRTVLLLCLTGLSLSPSSVAAGGSGESAPALERQQLLAGIVPEDRMWDVAVGLVVGEELVGRDLPAVGSWVQILRDAIDEVPRRYLTEEDRLSLQEALLGQRIAAVQRDLDRLRRAAEIQAIRRNPTVAPSGSAGVSTATETLQLLRDIDPASIPLPETLPVRVSREEYRFRRTLAGPDAWAEDAGVDSLIYLVVEPLDELTLITVRNYSRWSSPRDREITRVVAPPGQILSRLETAAATVVRDLVSRDLAAISVTVVDPENMPLPTARVFLDREPLGFAPVTRRFLQPGSYRLVALTDDQRRVERLVEVVAGETQAVTLQVDRVVRETVEVRSVPAGARVYAGAVWQGFTPLEMPVPRRTMELTLALEDYYQSRVTLNPDSSEVIERILVPLAADWEGQVVDARERMYRSIGFFIVSLAVPIVANGLYDDTGSLFPDGLARSDLNAEEQQAALDRADAIFWTYYGGVALSTGLFGNMLWRIVRYVRTAQQYHDR